MKKVTKKVLLDKTELQAIPRYMTCKLCVHYRKRTNGHYCTLGECKIDRVYPIPSRCIENWSKMYKYKVAKKVVKRNLTS